MYHFYKSSTISINKCLNEDSKLKLLLTDKTEDYVSELNIFCSPPIRLALSVAVTAQNVNFTN